MLKHGKFALALCLCLFAALFAVACSSGASSSASSSSAEKSEVLEANDSTVGSDDAFYALIVGDDSRYGTKDTGTLTEDDPAYSDVIVLAHIDPTTYRISLVSIPRDTGIELNGEHEKLNAAYHDGGMDGLVSQIEDMTGVDIEYTFDVGFKTYSDYINAIGGVTVDIPFDMEMSDPINGGSAELSGGDNQTLDGADALAFSRMRKMYGGSEDGSRQYQNRNVVKLLIEQALGSGQSAEDLVDTFYTYCKSNMDEQTLVGYVKQFQDNQEKITFQLGTFPYDGRLVEEWNSWQIPYDEEAYAEVIEAVENNTSIQDIVPDPDIFPKE